MLFPLIVLAVFCAHVLVVALLFVLNPTAANPDAGVMVGEVTLHVVP